MGQYITLYMAPKGELYKVLNPHTCRLGAKALENFQDISRYIAEQLRENPYNILIQGDYAENSHKGYIDPIMQREILEYHEKKSWDFHKYCIVNHTQKQYYNAGIYGIEVDYMLGSYVLLYILVYNSNGLGGGDFKIENTLIGSWAGDYIELSKAKPKEYISIDKEICKLKKQLEDSLTWES